MIVALATCFAFVVLVLVATSLARRILRLLLALCFAVGAGMVLGTAIGDPARQISYSTAFALLILPVAYWLTGRWRTSSSAASSWPATAGVPALPIAAASDGRTKGRRVTLAWRWRRPAAGDRAERAAAWTELSAALDGSHVRIARAEASCERLIALAAADPGLIDRHALVPLVRKRIPALIKGILRDTKGEPAGERADRLIACLDLLEDFAAQAERLMVRRPLASDRDIAILRRRLDSMIEQDGA